MHKPFIIAHLQKKLSAFPQMSGVVSVQHLPAVIFILYPQTEMKAGIAPDLVIDDPCRFLCAQQQMDARLRPMRAMRCRSARNSPCS